MVIGKKLHLAGVGKSGFDVAIPEKYAIVSENGLVGGTLDGAKLEGGRDMAAGHHEFIPDAPSKFLVVLLARAVRKGYSPFRPIHRWQTNDFLFRIRKHIDRGASSRC